MPTTIQDLVTASTESLCQTELAPYMALWSSVVHYRIAPELTLTSTAELETFMSENYFYPGVVPGVYKAGDLQILAELADAAIFGYKLLNGEGSILGTYKLCKAIKIGGEWKLVSLNFYAG